MHSIPAKGDLIGGEFRKQDDPTGEWKVISPADLTDELARVTYSYRSVDLAVESARRAVKGWRKLSPTARGEYLKKYKDALKARSEELTQVIAREVGKPLWEAASEVQTMLNKVDVTLNESLALIADRELPGILPGTHGASRYRPHGVMAVIGPFNFPGHLPNGHIVPALAAGNAVIFKPSEKSPLVGQLMAECFIQAGLPAGVFNLIQGEKEVGRRLCVHEGVDGVLFTGSYEVGLRIKQDTLQQYWKLLALEMGGKNAVIVAEDADLDWALHESLFGAFVTAGQRCSATSRILVQKSRLQEFVERFHARSKAFAIGHPMDNPFMGPLIDASSVDRYMKFQGIAAREGFEVLMRGKALEVQGRKGHYVTPSICVQAEGSVAATQRSVYQQSELFAPNVAIVGYTDLEEAVRQANATEFGLVCSVFTQSRTVYEHCREDLEVGLVNWNRTTVGASSKLPFGGTKKSGNHFPTALTATLYSAYPVASLELEKAPTPADQQVTAQKTPGLNWK